MENRNNISFDDFDPKNLQQDIDTLVANRNTYLKDLDKNAKLKNVYHSFRSSCDMLFPTDCYPQIWKMVDNSKRRIGKLDIQPETIGSYLFGCNLENYGDVKNKEDSPFCVNSVKKNNKFDFKNFIFVKSDEGLKLFSKPEDLDREGDRKKPSRRKVKVLVFFSVNNDKLLNADDVDKIRRTTEGYNVDKVLFYDLSTHKLVDKFSSIDKIPIIVFNGEQRNDQEKKKIGTDNNNRKTRQITNNNNNNKTNQNKKSSRGITISTGALIWLVIIIVIIILVIGGIGAMQKNRYKI